MKKFRKFLKISAALMVISGIVWSSFVYNNRPLPFDGATVKTPVEIVAKTAADKVNETAHKAATSDLDKLWEDTQSKAKELTGKAFKDNSASDNSGK